MSVNHNAWSCSTHTGPSPSSARRSHTGRGWVMSAPPGVDEMLMASDQPRIVRGEEQSEGRNVLRHQPAAQALRLDDLGFAFGRVPFELARGPDIARNDAADADIVAAELPREGAGEALDRGLGCLVER